MVIWGPFLVQAIAVIFHILSKLISVIHSVAFLLISFPLFIMFYTHTHTQRF